MRSTARSERRVAAHDVEPVLLAVRGDGQSGAHAFHDVRAGRQESVAGEGDGRTGTLPRPPPDPHAQHRGPQRVGDGDHGPGVVIQPGVYVLCRSRLLTPAVPWKPSPDHPQKNKQAGLFLHSRPGRLAGMSFVEPEERVALRQAVRDLAKRYGPDYVRRQAKAGLKSTELWAEVGPGRLPRRQPAGGVRRRGRRHRRPGRGRRGAGPRRLPAADDRGVPGHLRHHHRPLRHRGAEAEVAARASPTAPFKMAFAHHRAGRRLQLAQDHHHRRAATATSGCSPARRCSSPASTSPTPSWWSPAPRTRPPAT